MNKLHKIFECGNNQPRRWARIGAPRYVALAIAAVLEDIRSGPRPGAARPFFIVSHIKGFRLCWQTKNPRLSGLSWESKGIW